MHDKMSRTGHEASPLDDVISAQEASEILGLSKRQVTRLAESGQIEGKLPYGMFILVALMLTGVLWKLIGPIISSVMMIIQQLVGLG